MLNSVTRVPSWLAAHWRGAALAACGVAAIAALRWTHDRDPERAAQMKEKDTQTLAERISKYARDMQARYPDGSVVVSEDDLAGALHRAPERIARALGLLQSQQKVERAPLSGYWKLNA
ncbi:MAG TPA: hypothetical protein VFI95_12095 [Terriglobales bacterium]|nr:hypothetical protein [Terriglobales bacterium]